MKQTVSCQVGNETMVFETGRMAKQANGAIFATYGGSAVIATACCSDTATEGLDFVPLTVEYNEKYYAAGRIPGGFIKRESRPKDKEILVSRIIDRPMRPLFNKEFGREIQVVPTCVSADQSNPPDILAVNAASAAVHISDIPFAGPIAAVRVCLVGSEYIVNPTFKQIEESRLEIVVAGTAIGITMVEGGSQEASEEEMLAAIECAKAPISAICAAIEEMRSLAGKEKLPLAPLSIKLNRENEIRSYAEPLLSKALFTKGKQDRGRAVSAAISETKANFADALTDDIQKKLFGGLMDELQYNILRQSILDKGLRVDGRGLEDIRPITCEVGVLPRTHGSALFTRGETQSLGVTTLGTVDDEQVLDDIEGDRRERFMLQYNFPPYSVGEVGRLGTGRREIGHGDLARKAIEPMLPPKEKFPYTIRQVSEVLESNGSSSMATVCSSSLSLMNAGVPMRKPVAGIAMGLITDSERYAVLSDILGDEDHLGDMDFKVAGTVDGITGFQMDIKISSVSTEILRKALEQARKGRMHILSIMEQTLSEPAADISPYAPKVVSAKVDQDKIGMVIGPSGKNIKGMCEKFDVQINVDEEGNVTIYGKNQTDAYAARDAVLGLVEEPEVGKIYKGTVKRIMEFGAFIEILPGKEGLCHISRMSKERVEKVTDIVKEGDHVEVKLMEIDHMGRLNLAMLAALDENGHLPEQPGRSEGRSFGSQDRGVREPRRYGSDRRDGPRNR
ncbi:MAG: polyribonucleotide nucleotidyltransferase [Spirochaetaceae bacterium]|nr:polyribonucleotide nucleotidyltransferase [Spirochaetaceae bacterium]